MRRPARRSCLVLIAGLALASFVTWGCSTQAGAPLLDGSAAPPAAPPPLLGAEAEGESLPPGFNTEAYAAIQETGFVRTHDEPLSTFAIDVDTASYANTRRLLVAGALPPPGAVRLEELINYFPYDYACPTGPEPFAVHVAAAPCPWEPAHRLVRVALKGRELAPATRPPLRLTFLVDVSGSMQSANKLPLVQASLKLLVEQLQERDTVALVVYAGASGLVLPPTSGAHGRRIAAAIDALESGGGTNGAEGIRLAYQQARAAFVPGAANRVILATDGDFNLGATNESELVALIEKQAKSGVFLTVLGFGMGNLKDSTLEALADHGNGNYGYVDTPREAQKLLVEQSLGTLVTIAKDVKLQVELNPAHVTAYRLLGYENRRLAAQDFTDDAKDAGEIGAGHAVTALYQVVPVDAAFPGEGLAPLKYQGARGAAAPSDDLLTVKLRWKEPEGSTSVLREIPFVDKGLGWDGADADFRFAAAVASFGMQLRGSAHAGNATPEMVSALASSALGSDPAGYRRELLGLVGRWRHLARAAR